MADVLLPEMRNCLHSCVKMKLYQVTGVQSVAMNEFSRACFLLSCKTTRTFFVMQLNKRTSVVPMSQCYVIKQMVNIIACTIELWMHLGGLLSTQEARVALGYRLGDSYASFVLSNLPRASITQQYTLWHLPFVNLSIKNKNASIRIENGTHQVTALCTVPFWFPGKKTFSYRGCGWKSGDYDLKSWTDGYHLAFQSTVMSTGSGITLQTMESHMMIPSIIATPELI